jgi:membrane protein required for colicin V production
VGALFGLVRGGLIVFVGVMLAGLTSIPKEPFWREAALSGPVETAVLAAKPALPKDLAQRIRYR